MTTNHLQPQESQELSSGTEGLLILLRPPGSLCSSAVPGTLPPRGLCTPSLDLTHARCPFPPALPPFGVLSVRSVMGSLSYPVPNMFPDASASQHSGPYTPLTWDSLPVSPSKMPTQVLPAAVPSGMTGINISVGVQSTSSMVSHFTGQVRKGQGTSLRPRGSVD